MFNYSINIQKGKIILSFFLIGRSKEILYLGELIQCIHVFHFKSDSDGCQACEEAELMMGLCFYDNGCKFYLFFFLQCPVQYAINHEMNQCMIPIFKYLRFPPCIYSQLIWYPKSLTFICVIIIGRRSFSDDFCGKKS